MQRSWHPSWDVYLMTDDDPEQERSEHRNVVQRSTECNHSTAPTDSCDIPNEDNQCWNIVRQKSGQQ